MLSQRLIGGGESLLLYLLFAEGGLAVVDEDVGDLPPLGGDDVGVGVAHLHAPALRQQLPDGRLARPHGADQHHARTHPRAQVSASGRAAR